MGEVIGVKLHCCVGGTSVRDEKKALLNEVHHIIVGSKGRI
jgi:hypothetical protein